MKRKHDEGDNEERKRRKIGVSPCCSRSMCYNHYLTCSECKKMNCFECTYSCCNCEDKVCYSCREYSLTLCPNCDDIEKNYFECAKCRKECSICKKVVCSRHAVQCKECEKYTCNNICDSDCMNYCSFCNNKLCKKCNST